MESETDLEVREQDMNDLNKTTKIIRLLRIVLNSGEIIKFYKMKKINFKKNDELNEKLQRLKAVYTKTMLTIYLVN
jgi:hypothetical protein